MPIRPPRPLFRVTRRLTAPTVPYGEVLVAAEGAVVTQLEARSRGIPDDALEPFDPNVPLADRKPARAT